MVISALLADNRFLTDPAERRAILSSIMDWAPKRILALFLGLWIGLSPALMSAPAVSMVLQMAHAPDTISGDCECCPGTKASRTLCFMMCASVPPLAAAQCTGLIPPAVDDEAPAPVPDATLTSRIVAPDPPPPRRIAFS